MIDDNKNLVEMVKEYFLEHDKIEVTLCAYDGEEGLDKIINNKDNYDIVLLDLIMPKKDGLYVLEQIRERNMNVNVIVESSYNAPDVIRRVSEFGVNYYILKPFELVDLETRILDVFKIINSDVDRSQ